jgi:NADH-quinone oxidoreductase subunit M
VTTLFFIFAPLLFCGIVYWITLKTGGAKYIALAFFIAMFAESLWLYAHLPPQGYLALGSYLHVEAFDFVLTLQVDRLSVIMLLLTSVLLLFVTLASWSVKNQSAYFALLLFFAGPIFGLFASTNLLWFFIFWELTLVPLYFLIGIWGDKERIFAAMKFFLYTNLASMLLLLGFFLLYRQTGTFDMTLLHNFKLHTPVLIWWLLFLGFAVKMPLFPFHTWLPDAHVQAPAPVSALLAGVLLKMGAYGMLRLVVLMLPQETREFANIMLIFGLATLFYSAFMALWETHVKKMVAYSSISHMGLVAIALSTVQFGGMAAALFEMIGHALVISVLFVIAGIFHQKTQSWQMRDMGGIIQKAPYLATFFVIAGLAALGFPATIGFIGELAVLFSAIKAHGVWLALVAAAALLASGYMIWTFRRVIYGERSQAVANGNFAISKPEFAALALFVLLILLFGLFPQLLFGGINKAFAAYHFLGAVQ